MERKEIPMEMITKNPAACICGLQAGLVKVAGALAFDDGVREIDLTTYDSGWNQTRAMVQFLSDQVTLLNPKYRVEIADPYTFDEEVRKHVALPAFYCNRINDRGEKQSFIVSRAKRGFQFYNRSSYRDWLTD
jgi:hypothetical protein